MPDAPSQTRYRFGVFELDAATGELRRRGIRVRLHAQPFQVLTLLLARPGEMLTREEISRALWPAGTYVDYDHGVNSAVNRLREALGDPAKTPRFIETIARRGYRFIAPVEEIVPEPPSSVTEQLAQPEPQPPASPASPRLLSRVLAQPEDLPQSSPVVVRTLFVALQLMYLAFYIAALSNLPEIEDLLSALGHGAQLAMAVTVTAALMIPVRIFLLCAVLFHAPALTAKFLRMWPFLLLADVLWSLSPFLLLHHFSAGLALACTALLVYSPFAQRSLMLMGAGDSPASS